MDGLQTLENILQSLVAGVLIGAMYGLMCVGLTIIFGVMRVINFAQGEFMMLGMYFAYFCFAWFGSWRFLTASGFLSCWRCWPGPPCLCWAWRCTVL